MKGKNKEIGRETKGTSLQMLQTRKTVPEYWGQCDGDTSGKRDETSTFLFPKNTTPDSDAGGKGRSEES